MVRITEWNTVCFSFRCCFLVCSESFCRTLCEREPFCLFCPCAGVLASFIGVNIFFAFVPNYFKRQKEQVKPVLLISLYSDKSDSTNYLARTQAAWANRYSLGSAVNERSYLLNVSFPRSVASSVRMADSDSECYAFSANITFCHLKTPPFRHGKYYNNRFSENLQVFFLIFRNFSDFI